MDWLLSEDALLELQAIKGIVPTAEQREAFAAVLKAREASISAGEPRLIKIEGTEAKITIDGVLMERPSFMSMFMSRGAAIYSDIRAAFEAAEADPRVKTIALDINSPGGTVEGMFETLDVIAQVTKKIKVTATQATSAAYAIASMAGPISAATRSSQFGSVGVVARYMVWPEDVTLTSTDAPEKAPDPRTPEGKALIVKRLDSINEMFVGSIAKGRTAFTGSKVTPESVKQNFGRGATMYAADALAAGLIDKAPKEPRLARARAEDDTPADASAVETADGGEEIQVMDIKEFKAKHPELFTAAFEEGKTAGEAAERDRVDAHLTMGEASGDTKTAFEAIRKGDAMTTGMQAKYMAAGMRTAAVGARGDEAAIAAAATAGVKPAAGAGGTPGTGAAAATGDLGDLIVALIDADKQS
jgi:ClpP class serine protease